MPLETGPSANQVRAVRWCGVLVWLAGFTLTFLAAGKPVWVQLPAAVVLGVVGVTLMQWGSVK